MQTQTSNTLHNAIMEAGSKDRPPILAPVITFSGNPESRDTLTPNLIMNLGWKDKPVPDSDGNLTTTTERVFETYKNVKQDIRNQLNAEAEAVQIILTGIDNDIYSIVDACSNASQQAATRNRGKAIVNSPQPIYDQEPSMVDDDDETNAGYESQRIGNVAGARETIEQADWKDDTDDESDDQELEAHYMYMAKVQEVLLDAVDSGPIFDTKPEQKVQNYYHYDVFAIDCQYPEQSKSVHKTYLIEQDAHNVTIESLDMNYDSEQINQNDEDADLAKERELLASLIEKLKCEIDESKNRNKFLETSNKEPMAWQTDYAIMKEGMSILRGRKSVTGINSHERGNGKKELLGLHVGYM
nr:hypothetical protein [Tanacetum cinerariifolium]